MSTAPSEPGAGANPAWRAFRTIVDVQPGEARTLLLSWLYFFFVLASTFVLRPLRDSMGLNGGPDKYPWLFTGTLVAMIAVSPLFALLVTRLPRRRFIPVVYQVSVACLLAFWIVLTFLPERFALAAAYTFFVWFSVFNLFVVSVYRGFMADVWDLAQAKRLFGFIGAGGTLGALAGSLASRLLAGRIGSVNLLFVSVVLLELAVVCVYALIKIHRIDAASPASPTQHVAAPDMWRGLKLVAREPYLRWIAAYIFLYGLLGTFLYSPQGKLVERTIADRDARTAYYAGIEFWVQLLTIGVQFFLTARLIRWFGITFALVSQPAIAVLGWILLSLAMLYGSAWAAHGLGVGDLAVITVLQVLLRVSNFSTAQPAREALYTVVEREVKYKSKSFIDTFVYRFGDSLGAWFFSGLLALGVTLTGIAWLTIPIAALWVVVGVQLGRRQRAMTAQAAPPANDGG